MRLHATIHFATLSQRERHTLTKRLPRHDRRGSVAPERTMLSPCAGAVETGKCCGSTRKGSGAAEAKAKRTQPRPLPLPQAARLALTQYTNTACVPNTILAYLPRITRNSRSNDLSSLNTKLRLEVGRLYALVPLTYFWKSLLPDSACVQSRRSPLTNRAS